MVRGHYFSGMQILTSIGQVLLIPLVLAVFVGVVVMACRFTAALFPLNERYSEVVERSLPVRGRWLRWGLRVALFPVVLIFCWYLCGIILFAIVQVIMAIVSLFHSH